MTIVYTIKSNHQGQGNYRLRKQQKKQQKLQEKYKEFSLSRKIERIMLGTSSNVAKALNMPTVKSSKPTSSSCCLHEIFIFAVKSGNPENITAR